MTKKNCVTKIRTIRPKKPKPVTRKTTTKKKKPVVGQTLETNDIYLPYKNNPKPKSRPAIIVAINKYGYYAVIPATSQSTKHSTYYGKYGIKYYRHNIEIEDNEGNPISVNKKFRLTDNCSKIPPGDVAIIKNAVLEHTKFSSENKIKMSQFQIKK